MKLRDLKELQIRNNCSGTLYNKWFYKNIFLFFIYIVKKKEDIQIILLHRSVSSNKLNQPIYQKTRAKNLFSVFRIAVWSRFVCSCIRQYMQFSLFLSNDFYFCLFFFFGYNFLFLSLPCRDMLHFWPSSRQTALRSEFMRLRIPLSASVAHTRKRENVVQSSTCPHLV